MVLKKEVSVYECEECGLKYADEETARACQEWCSAHKSCNLEIIAKALPFSE